jgi:hypothetical protein
MPTEDVLAQINAAISMDPTPPVGDPQKVPKEPEVQEPEEPEVGETSESEQGDDHRNLVSGDGEKSEPEVETEEIELDTDIFASALGLDENSLEVTEDGEVKFKTKIDGQEGSVNLSELLKGYQLEGHITQKSQKLSEDRRAFEQERDAQMKELTTALGQAKQLLELSEQSLLQEFNIDWNTLRTENPAEFAAKRQEFTEKYNQLQQAKNFTAQQSNALNEQQLAEIYQKEQTQLLEKIPTWADEATAKTEKAELNSYLVGVGFTQEEINSWMDHRAIAVARDAMLYRKQTKQVDIAKKKVVAKPKVIKPGKGKTNADKTSEQLKLKIKRAKKTGSVNDVAAVLRETMR